MGTRTLILIGIALVLLFVCGIGSSGVLRRGSDEQLIDTESLRALGDRIHLARPLSLDDLENLDNCPRSSTTITVVANETCKFQASSTRLPIPRTVKLRLVQGTTLNVRFQQPEVLNVEKDLSTQETEEITVYRKGGQLELSCVGSGACRVEFE